MMHMADDLMTKALYDERAPEALEFARIVAATVHAVVSDPSPHTIDSVRTELDAIASFVRGTEAGFIRMLGRLAANVERAPDARGLFKRVLNGPYGRLEGATYLLQRARGVLGLEGRVQTRTGIAMCSGRSTVRRSNW